MSFDRTRAHLLGLRHTTETLQWGSNLIYRVMDKAVGGKLFAIVDSEPAGRHVVAFAAGPERFHELLEIEGIFPAPYFARAFWVAVESWDVLPPPELTRHLTSAHALVLSKLPARVRAIHALPDREYRRVVRERRVLLKSSASVSRS